MRAMRILPFCSPGGAPGAGGGLGRCRRGPFAQGDVHILRAGGKAESAGNPAARGGHHRHRRRGYAQLTMADDAIVAVRP